MHYRVILCIVLCCVLHMLSNVGGHIAQMINAIYFRNIVSIMVAHYSERIPRLIRLTRRCCAFNPFAGQLGRVHDHAAHSSLSLVCLKYGLC